MTPGTLPSAPAPVPPVGPEAASAMPALANNAAVAEAAGLKTAAAGSAVEGLVTAATPVIGLAAVGVLMWKGLQAIVTGQNPFKKK